MVNTRGPALWRVPGSTGLVLAVSTAVGSPSVSADLPFRFPRDCFVKGVLVLLRADPVVLMPALQGMTSLRVLDQHQDPIVSDTRGTMLGTTNAPSAAPLLALHGKGFAPYAMQRPVSAGRSWTFSLQNIDLAVTPTVAGIFIYFGDRDQ